MHEKNAKEEVDGFMVISRHRWFENLRGLLETKWEKPGVKFRHRF